MAWMMDHGIMRIAYACDAACSDGAADSPGVQGTEFIEGYADV